MCLKEATKFTELDLGCKGNSRHLNSDANPFSPEYTILEYVSRVEFCFSSLKDVPVEIEAFFFFSLSLLLGREYAPSHLQWHGLFVAHLPTGVTNFVSDIL